MSALAYMFGAAFMVWIILPLFKKDSTWVSLHMEAEELADQKQRVYGNIADLEFDFAMGRLSESDFNEVRQSFLREAGRVIEKLESQKSSKLMDRIENDVAHLGNKKEKEAASDTRYCIECGTENQSSAKFCMKCGEELS